MIYGNINNEFFEQQTAILPKPLQSALRFLKETDLANHEPGKFDISLNGVPAILQVLDITTSPRETLRPEIHRKISMCSFWLQEARRRPVFTVTTDRIRQMRIFWILQEISCFITTIQTPLKAELQ